MIYNTSDHLTTTVLDRRAQFEQAANRRLLLRRLRSRPSRRIQPGCP